MHCRHPNYDDTFAILVYAPEDDAFYGLYSHKHTWVTGCLKLMNSFRDLTYLLRKIFPDRFRGAESEELVIPISSGDYPNVKRTCLDHFRKQPNSPLTPPDWRNLSQNSCYGYIAPVLHFGSVFRERYNPFPNMIAMPMPEPRHLPCFVHWTDYKDICHHLRLIYGEESWVEWEDLIPQVVWRGTDFPYLPRAHPLLDKAHFDELPVELQSKIDKEKHRIESIRHPKRATKTKSMLNEISKAAAVKAMKDEYKSLYPRWKAVVLTAEAEVDATEHDDLPWANMKFSSFVSNGSKKPTVGAEQYKEWEDIDFPATGEHMDLPELARYKYHIDIGGGGGTTWSGTIEKLAMPGLLFHHMTPTKDYIHDYMKPWVHYVPVAADLSDLKDKYEWAESHPVKAKKIADEGTKLIRYLTSKEGFQDMFVKDMATPLHRVIEAYQPISTIQEGKSWSNWKDAIDQIEGKDVLLPVIECMHSANICKEYRAKRYNIKGALLADSFMSSVPSGVKGVDLSSWQ